MPKAPTATMGRSRNGVPIVPKTAPIVRSRRRPSPGEPELEVEDEAQDGQNDPFKRARKRKAERARRQAYVASVRGTGSKSLGLRATRSKSQIVDAADTLLGRPGDRDPGLPIAIAEKYYRSTDQTGIVTGTATAIKFDVANFTAEETDYPAIYDTSTWYWTIPPGLSGVWQGLGVIRWAADGTATGNRQGLIYLNDTTEIYNYRVNAETTAMTIPIAFTYLFEEGDFFQVRGVQSSGGNLSVTGGLELTHFSLDFRGTA